MCFYYVDAYVYVCVCADVCHMGEGAHRGQKRVARLLQLKFRQLKNGLMWTLGTELESSARAASPHNY